MANMDGTSAVTHDSGGEPLLAYLDARVALTSAGPPRLTGTVCVGVRRNGHTRWWVAHLGKRIETAFADSLPADFDAGVLVDPATATWVLGASPERGPLHLVAGDPDLLQRFLARYIGHTSPLGMRMQESAAR
jgi:hypothetical protein